MPQGQWATQQSANDVSATTYAIETLISRGYVPQAPTINEHGLLADVANALLNCLPQSFSVSFTPAATAAASAVEQTLTVNGSNAAVGDRVIVTFPGAPTANLGISHARVSTAGLNAVVSIQFINPTAGSLTAPSGNYTITFIRS